MVAHLGGHLERLGQLHLFGVQLLHIEICVVLLTVVLELLQALLVFGVVE